MSEAASRLTVKVKLHPAVLPPETDAPQVQPAPWSKTRITLASLMLVGAGVAGYQFLLRPVAPEKPATSTVSQQKVDVVQTIATPEAGQLAAPDLAGTSASTVPSQVDAAAATATSAPEVTPAAAALTGADSEPATQQAQVAVPQPELAPDAPVPTADRPSTVTASIPASARMVLPESFSRIVLTDQMNNLQPGKAVGQLINYPQIKRLYLFTELKNYAGQILRHRWYFRDKLHTEAVLTIEDSPWRTYSENWLLDNQRGPWRVEIVDQTQKVIFQYSFNYQ